MSNPKQPNCISRICYRAIRGLVKLFYPRITSEGTENLSGEPCIVVSNHCQMNGPIACELYFPGNRLIWCASQMMYLKEVPGYAFEDFWSGKPRYLHWFYRLLSYLIAPISVLVFNLADTIPVYRDMRLVTTFRKSVEALEQGTNVIIFPECKQPHNHIVNQFQDRFIDVARMYYKRTGKAVRFVPMYLTPTLKKICLGTPIVFDPQAPIAAERARICDGLMQAITDMAQALPPHTVIPYENLPRKAYPMNLPREAKTNHEKTSR